MPSKYEVEYEERSKFRKPRQHALVRILLLLLVGALVATVVLAVMLVKESNHHSSRTEMSDAGRCSTAKPCKTKGCKDAASIITENMDPGADPCVDFYQFACGGFLEKQSIPEGRGDLTNTIRMQDGILDLIKSVVKKSPKSNEPSYISKMKNYYASCINPGRDKRGFQPLRDLINEDFGGFRGWPLAVNQWDESCFDLEPAIIQANRLNATPVVVLSVVDNFRHPTQRILKADRPRNFGMGEAPDYHVPRNDSRFVAYEERVFEVAMMYGVADEERARMEISEMVDFEYALANSADPRPYSTNLNRTIKAWDKTRSVPVFNWPFFLDQVVSAPEIGITDLSVEEEIFVGDPRYHKLAKDILQNTPSRTLANYITWIIIGQYYDTLGTDEARSTKVTEKMKDDCLSSMVYYNDFRYAASKLFLDLRYSDEDEEFVENLVPQIQAAFNASIEGQEWLEEDWIEQMKEKNAAVRTKIGYAKSIYTEENVERIYSNVTFDKRSYFDNAVNFNRDSFDRMVRTLRDPVVFDESRIFTPIQGNAYYDEYTNSIEISAAIMQLPFYRLDFPKSFNYGGIGYVIGHELLHGFDYTGLQFDKNGNDDWLNLNVPFGNVFYFESLCYRDQYDTFVVPEANMTVNGWKTIDENMGDTAGLSYSFEAYRKWVRSQGGEEAPVKGLEQYSHDQLFFISYAQSFCQLLTKEEAIRQVTSYSYPPGRFRVNGPVQNLEDFANAFYCPRNSPMNPTKKCDIF